MLDERLEARVRSLPKQPLGHIDAIEREGACAGERTNPLERVGVDRIAGRRHESSPVAPPDAYRLRQIRCRGS